MGSDKDVLDMFKSIGRQIDVQDFYYQELCDYVNSSYSTMWNRYTKELQNRYFKSPWVIICVNAAVMMMILLHMHVVGAVLALDHMWLRRRGSSDTFAQPLRLFEAGKAAMTGEKPNLAIKTPITDSTQTPQNKSDLAIVTAKSTPINTHNPNHAGASSGITKNTNGAHKPIGPAQTVPFGMPYTNQNNEYKGVEVDVVVEDVDTVNLVDLVIEYWDKTVESKKPIPKHASFAYVHKMKHVDLITDQDLMKMFTNLNGRDLIHIWVGEANSLNELLKAARTLRASRKADELKQSVGQLGTTKCDPEKGIPRRSLRNLEGGSSEPVIEVERPKKLTPRRNTSSNVREPVDSVADPITEPVNEGDNEVDGESDGEPVNEGDNGAAASASTQGKGKQAAAASASTQGKGKAAVASASAKDKGKGPMSYSQPAPKMRKFSGIRFSTQPQ
uniref:Uncharacterized protein n=1 Tax=Chenopodium quinoa TaxID=63459 RepID=A0A803MSY6_CHEQI